MLGVGPDARKYLLERPTHEEVERSLWQLVFEARCKVDDVKRELRDKNDRWRTEEKNPDQNRSYHFEKAAHH